MHWKLFRPLFFLAMAPTVALAQTPSPAQDGRAGAPAASDSAYQSAFADYKPYIEPVVMSWRKANDQVRDTVGMQGHDMATINSPSEDPHAGHDMSKMTPAKPAAPAPIKPHPPSTAKKPGANHGAMKAQAADPHAGHDMSKMSAPPANQPKNKREKE